MMIIMILLLIICFLISIIVPNLIVNFSPFFIISALVILSAITKENKKLYIVAFIFGVLYDLMLTDLVFLHGFIFITILYVCKMILKGSSNFFLICACYFINVILYELIMSLFSLFNANLNLFETLNKFKNSFLLNFLFFIVLYVLFIGIKCLISNRKKTYTY